MFIYKTVFIATLLVACSFATCNAADGASSACTVESLDSSSLRNASFVLDAAFSSLDIFQENVSVDRLDVFYETPSSTPECHEEQWTSEQLPILRAVDQLAVDLLHWRNEILRLVCPPERYEYWTSAYELQAWESCALHMRARYEVSRSLAPETELPTWDVWYHYVYTFRGTNPVRIVRTRVRDRLSERRQTRDWAWQVTCKLYGVEPFSNPDWILAAYELYDAIVKLSLWSTAAMYVYLPVSLFAARERAYKDFLALSEVAWLMLCVGGALWYNAVDAASAGSGLGAIAQAWLMLMCVPVAPLAQHWYGLGGILVSYAEAAMLMLCVGVSMILFGSNKRACLLFGALMALPLLAQQAEAMQMDHIGFDGSVDFAGGGRGRRNRRYLHWASPVAVVAEAAARTAVEPAQMEDVVQTAVEAATQVTSLAWRTEVATQTDVTGFILSDKFYNRAFVHVWCAFLMCTAVCLVKALMDTFWPNVQWVHHVLRAAPTRLTFAAAKEAVLDFAEQSLATVEAATWALLDLANATANRKIFEQRATTAGQLMVTILCSAFLHFVHGMTCLDSLHWLNAVDLIGTTVLLVGAVVYAYRPARVATWRFRIVVGAVCIVVVGLPLVAQGAAAVPVAAVPAMGAVATGSWSMVAWWAAGVFGVIAIVSSILFGMYKAATAVVAWFGNVVWNNTIGRMLNFLCLQNLFLPFYQAYLVMTGKILINKWWGENTTLSNSTSVSNIFTSNTTCNSWSYNGTQEDCNNVFLGDWFPRDTKVGFLSHLFFHTLFTVLVLCILVSELYRTVLFLFRKLARIGQDKVAQGDRVTDVEPRPSWFLSVVFFVCGVLAYMMAATLLTVGSVKWSSAHWLGAKCWELTLGASNRLTLDNFSVDQQLDAALMATVKQIEAQQATDQVNMNLRPSNAADNLRRVMAAQPHYARVFTAQKTFQDSEEKVDINSGYRFLITQDDMKSLEKIGFRLLSSDNKISSKVAAIAARALYIVHLTMLPYGKDKGEVVHVAEEKWIRPRGSDRSTSEAARSHAVRETRPTAVVATEAQQAKAHETQNAGGRGGGGRGGGGRGNGSRGGGRAAGCGDSKRYGRNQCAWWSIAMMAVEATRRLQRDCECDESVADDASFEQAMLRQVLAIAQDAGVEVNSQISLRAAWTSVAHKLEVVGSKILMGGPRRVLSALMTLVEGRRNDIEDPLLAIQFSQTSNGGHVKAWRYNYNDHVWKDTESSQTCPHMPRSAYYVFWGIVSTASVQSSQQVPSPEPQPVRKNKMLAAASVSQSASSSSSSSSSKRGGVARSMVAQSVSMPTPRSTKSTNGPRTISEAKQLNGDLLCEGCGKKKCEHELPNRHYFEIECAGCARNFCGTCAPRMAMATKGKWKCERCAGHENVRQSSDLIPFKSFSMNNSSSSTSASSTQQTQGEQQRQQQQRQQQLQSDSQRPIALAPAVRQATTVSAASHQSAMTSSSTQNETTTSAVDTAARQNDGDDDSEALAKAELRATGKVRIIAEVDKLDDVQCFLCKESAENHDGKHSRKRVTQCKQCGELFRGKCGPADNEVNLFWRVAEKNRKCGTCGTQQWTCKACKKENGDVDGVSTYDQRELLRHKRLLREEQLRKEKEIEQRRSERVAQQNQTAALAAKKNSAHMLDQSAAAWQRSDASSASAERTMGADWIEGSALSVDGKAATASEAAAARATSSIDTRLADAVRTVKQGANGKAQTAATAASTSSKQATANSKATATKRGAGGKASTAAQTAAAMASSTATAAQKASTSASSVKAAASTSTSSAASDSAAQAVLRMPLPASQMTELFQADSAINPQTESCLLGGCLRNLGVIAVQKQQIHLMRGLSDNTRRRHIRALLNFDFEVYRNGWEKSTLADAIVQYIDMMTARQAWQKTTRAREAANLVGALAQLQFYSASRIAVYPTRDKKLAMAMKHWEREAKAAQPHDQPTALAADIAEAVELAAEDKVVQALLMLQWCFAGRQGDMLKAQRRAILDYNETSGEIKMSFKFGKKTARGGDPYTLTSTVPERWRTAVAAYLRSRRRNQMLFDPSEKMLGARATQALRLANDKLNARSIRRGALQAMGAKGVALDLIQSFAGHQRQETTLRYLGWAAKWKAGQDKQAQAAKALELGLAMEIDEESSSQDSGNDSD